jgi:hypothetical protein
MWRILLEIIKWISIWKINCWSDFHYATNIKKYNEFGIETYHLVMDFKAAYESVDRFNLYIPMKELQIPKNILRVLT